MAGLQFFDVTLAANKTRDVDSEGTYFRYHSGSAGGADETLLVKADTGGLSCLLRPGQSIKLPATVKSWRLSNYANAGTINGIVVVGDGEITDSQVAGSVSVINGELSRVKANGCFVGFASCAPVAGQMSHCQLWNPAGSGKNIIVNKLSIVNNNASAIGICSTIATVGAISGSSASKKLGGAAPAAEVRGGAFAAAQGTQIANFSMSVPLESKEFQFSEPFIIPPSNGLAAFAAVVLSQTYVTFQWNEEPI